MNDLLTVVVLILCVFLGIYLCVVVYLTFKPAAKELWLLIREWRQGRRFLRDLERMSKDKKNKE